MHVIDQLMNDVTSIAGDLHFFVVRLQRLPCLTIALTPYQR
uniref:DinG family ATP-dependent helicase YoaA n=1 Tax=Klebsiella pneumoniae TaxID=573 RepID=A0A8B0SS08_KLEPN|nr:DinG family ATP-dependent helicase YoaA [Klebsiella pneumoniae]